MFAKIVIGGTFDGLHEGHQRILKAAFDNGASVAIGLTSDSFAERFRTKRVSGYRKRKDALEAYVKQYGKEYDVFEINDSYGIATLDPDIDCIVVSEETLLRAEEINTIRFKKKLPKLTIIVVPLVMGKDGKPLSSSD
jgi:pantetheine-phosphate adenylyltransferase